MKKNTGFTLVELMIVVVIIGILAAIAVPNYMEYVARSKLTESTSNLSDYRVKLEQFYQDNRNYGTAGAATCGAGGVPALPTGKYFTITCRVGATDQTFVATARNRAGVGLGAVGDYEFNINESNVRNTVRFKGAASGLPCWISNKGATC